MCFRNWRPPRDTANIFHPTERLDRPRPSGGWPAFESTRRFDETRARQCPTQSERRRRASLSEPHRRCRSLSLRKTCEQVQGICLGGARDFQSSEPDASRIRMVDTAIGRRRDGDLFARRRNYNRSNEQAYNEAHRDPREFEHCFNPRHMS